MTEKTSLLAGASSRAMFHAPVSGSALLRGPQVAYSQEGEGGGALSIDQAVASLDAHEDQSAQEAPEGAADGLEEPQGEASSPGDADDGAEPPADGDETGAELEPVAAAEPPKYWSKDAKAIFAAMTPEQQAVVLAQEGPREEITAKVKAEAAEQSQKAQAEMGRVAQLAEALADRLPQWVETFQSRWGTQTPDWVAYAEQHGVEAMTLAKTQFEQEQHQLREAAQATQIVQAQAREAEVKAEVAKLAELAPDLVDPKTGPAKVREISEYLAAQGIPAAAVQNISAIETVIARKAMLWDQAQAKAKAAPNPAPKTTPQTRPLTRGGASPGPSDPKAKAAQTAKNRFAQTRSIADAVAYLDAQGN